MRRSARRPSAVGEDEAFGGVGAFDDFDGPSAVNLERVAQLVSCVAAICEHMTQPREAKTHGLQHIHCSVTVLNVSGKDQDEDQKSAGVGQDMALTTTDLFARIIALNSAAFGGFDALTVDNAC